MMPSPTIESFIADRQAQGLSPTVAFLMYQEFNTFANPEVINETLLDDNDRRRLAIKQRLTRALEGIRTTDDWAAYCRHWTQLAFDLPQDQPVDMTVKKSLIAAHEDLWPFLAHHEDRGNLMDRMTLMSFSGGTGRNLSLADGMTWERLSEIMHADRIVPDDILATPMPLAPIDLNAVLRATGVRSVTWPWVNGQDPAVVSWLALQLNQAQTELCERTGWRGPVLGLNGALRLSMTTSDPLGEVVDGSLTAESNRSFLLSISGANRHGWAAIGHEWFHGLDYYLDGMVHPNLRSPRSISCLSEAWRPDAGLLHQNPDLDPTHRPVSQAFDALLTTLIVEGPGSDVRRTALEEAQRSWAQRISHSLPWSVDLVVDEQRRLDAGDWNRNEALSAWSEGYRRHDRLPVDHADMLAETIVTEIEFLHTADPSATSTSLWREFVQRLDENIVLHHPDAPWRATLEGYFELPEEVLAHSFEATFDRPGALIVNAEQVPLRYPVPSERRWQRQAWDRFFTALTPTWELLTRTHDHTEHLAMATRRMPSRSTLAERLDAAAVVSPISPAPAPVVPEAPEGHHALDATLQSMAKHNGRSTRDLANLGRRLGQALLDAGISVDQGLALGQRVLDRVARGPSVHRPVNVGEQRAFFRGFREALPETHPLAAVPERLTTWLDEVAAAYAVEHEHGVPVTLRTRHTQHRR